MIKWLLKRIKGDQNSAAPTDARIEHSIPARSFGLSGDRPIETPEEDRLGYQRFAERLAHSIRTMAPPEGLVMALHGPWGSGKTSIINLTVRELTSHGKPGETDVEVVRFNPWWFSGEESLVSAFFREVGSSIGDDLGVEVKEKFKKIGRRVSSLGGLVETVLAFVPGGSPFAEMAKKLGGSLGDVTAEDESLDALRESLRKLLAAQQKRILVIIDDIDRLLPEEGRQIFKLVKSVADLPKVTYLLTFDRRYAEEVANKDGHASGSEFLEKIVQVPFDLPSPDPIAINGIFFDGLGQIVGDLPADFDKTRWGNVFHDGVAPFLERPRHVARLLNSIRVTWPAVAGEVDLPDFVFLQTIRTFRPRLYEFIEINKARFAGLSDRQENREARSPFYDRALEGEKERNEALRNGLMRVFPQVESAWTNHGYSHEFLRDWRRQRRACSPEHFPTYFRLALGSEALPVALFQEFIERCGDQKYVSDLLMRLAGEHTGRHSNAERFLELIQDYTDKAIPSAAISTVLGGIYDVADNLLATHDLRPEMFEFGVDVSMGRIQWQLTRRLDQKERERILLSIATATRSISFLVREISVLGQEQGKHSERPDPEDQWTVSKDELEKLEGIAVSRIEALAKSGKLIEVPQLPSVLFRWRDWASPDAVQAWANEISSIDSLLRIASEFTSYTSSYSMGMFGLGDRVTTRRPLVSRGSMSQLIDVERVQLAMRSVLDDVNQAPENKKIAKGFLDGLANDDRGPRGG